MSKTPNTMWVLVILAASLLAVLAINPEARTEILKLLGTDGLIAIVLFVKRYVEEGSTESDSEHLVPSATPMLENTSPQHSRLRRTLLG